MQTYGVDAVVRILSHFVFIYVSFWALQSVRIDQFFKKIWSDKCGCYSSFLPSRLATCVARGS